MRVSSASLKVARIRGYRARPSLKHKEKSNMYNYEQDVSIGELLGKTLTKIDRKTDELVFHCDDGTSYKMFHAQNCCESVTIGDITGDLNDLIGVPILEATESTKEGEIGCDSETWTFYKFATIKGWVDIRWYGTSNGYYSERVDFVEL
jgi:hypothetical protein